MEELTDRWVISSPEMVVGSISFGWTIQIRFDPGSELHEIAIGCPFELDGPGVMKSTVDPSEPVQAAVLLPLIRKPVESVLAFKDGRLVVTFENGNILTVEVSPNFEPWELVGSSGLKLVSLPGGGLATWGTRTN